MLLAVFLGVASVTMLSSLLYYPNNHDLLLIHYGMDVVNADLDDRVVGQRKITVASTMLRKRKVEIGKVWDFTWFSAVLLL